MYVSHSLFISVQISTCKSCSKPVEISQSDVCTSEMLDELHKTIQMADITISQKDEIIEELSENYTSLEGKLARKDAKFSKLTAHLSFLSLDQKCS